ncbi:MAG: WD40 repeat domain-containing protein [Pyrinomonadaceae bacterium]
MKLPKYMSRSPALTITPYLLLLVSLGFVLLGLTLPAIAQRRTSTGNPTGFDDVVFAISFSPDGRTLAIARGASEPVHRFGRVELWDTETGNLRRLIKGFDGPVRSIAFSPDGHTLISSSTEFRSPKIQQKTRSREGVSFGELKWWDPRTGELKQKLIRPGEDSYSIRATQSPDGKQLALAESFLELTRFVFRPMFETQGSARFSSSVFFRSEIKLVDAQTGELRSKLDASQPGATSFSPDGSLLAVANGTEVKLWNVQTGKEARKLKDLRGTANAIAFSPDGRSLAVASTKYEREYGEHVIKIIGISEVKLFDVTTGKVTLRLKNVGAVNSVAFSADGRILVVGGVLPQNNGEFAGMKLFDFETGKVWDFTTGANYKEAVDSLVFSRNGGLLAFRSGPATVKLLDTRKGTIAQTWGADSVGDAVERSTSRFLLSVTRVVAVAFSADGKIVSGESDHGEIKSWDHRTGEVKRHLRNEEDNPSLVAASTDGKSFAEVSQGKLLFWDANSDTKRTVPLPGLQGVSALALSANGQMLAVGSGSEITLLSPTGEVVKKLSGFEGLVSRLAFSNDGRLLTGADEDGTIRIWKVASGGLEKTLMAGIEITALVFGPNGETLATAAADYSISIWNLQTGLSQGKLQKHDATINALAFSPNGQWLASGGDDRTIVLWEVAVGKSKRTFKGHDQTVSSLAFSPDGRLLASGSGNASVVLWEVGTGKLSRVLR